jgi:hypothetical protein
MRNRVRSYLVASAGALVAASLASYAYAAAAAIKISDQKIKGNEVTVADVTLPKDGLLVINPSDSKGNPLHRDIGHLALKAGEHKSVRVKVSGTQKAGEKLWATLKTDSKMPFKENGKTVEQSFKAL